jgi:hypothetical protein
MSVSSDRQNLQRLYPPDQLRRAAAGCLRLVHCLERWATIPAGMPPELPSTAGTFFGEITSLVNRLHAHPILQYPALAPGQSVESHADVDMLREAFHRVSKEAGFTWQPPREVAGKTVPGCWLGAACAGTPLVSAASVEALKLAAETAQRLAEVLDESNIGPHRSAFMRARDCRDTSINTHKQLKAMLDREPGIRREHRGQHLYVHAGDWHRWTAEQDRRETEALNTAPEAVERTLQEIRAKKIKKAARKQ